MPKPGPRSAKQSVIARNRGSLGDTTDESVSSSDDSSVDNTSFSGSKENLEAKTLRTRLSRRLAGASDSQFHTPEPEKNVTDYGLEFTTSNIQNPSPRRCSTLKTGSSQEEQVTSAERTKGRKQQAASKEAKKQNATKEAKQQNASKVEKKSTFGRGGDGDSTSNSEEEEAVENTDSSRLQEEQQTYSGGTKKLLGSKELKKQFVNKETSKQNATKNTKKQSVIGDTATEDELVEQRAEGSRSRRTLREDNTITVTQANSKNTKITKQNSSTASKTSAPHEQPRQASMARAPRESTAKQIPQGKSQLSTTQAVAVKKRRKQKNPMQKERQFWREVNALQARCDHLIPRLPFSRLIREIMMEASRCVTQITPTALEALQTASEMYVTQRLQDAYMLTLHRGRVTLDARDMELLCFLKH